MFAYVCIVLHPTWGSSLVDDPTWQHLFWNRAFADPTRRCPSYLPSRSWWPKATGYVKSVCSSIGQGEVAEGQWEGKGWRERFGK